METIIAVIVLVAIIVGVFTYRRRSAASRTPQHGPTVPGGSGDGHHQQYQDEREG